MCVYIYIYNINMSGTVITCAATSRKAPTDGVRAPPTPTPEI